MSKELFPYTYRENAFHGNETDVTFEVRELSDFGLENEGRRMAFFVKGELAGVNIYDDFINYIMVTEIGHQFLQQHAPEMEYKTELPKASEKRLKQKIFGDLFNNGSPDWRDDNKDIKLIKSQFGKFTENLHEKFCNDYFAFPITNIGRHMIKAVKELNVDISYFDKFKYNDPYYGYEHSALVPVMAFIKPEHKEKYRKILSSSVSSHTLDIVFDKEETFFREGFEDIDFHSENPHVKMLLGAGYTDCTLPSDGSVNAEYVTLTFDDFYLICLAQIWFNK